MQCITLSGVDGSGKSTQLEMLKNKLESDDKKVFYFHAIEFSLANKLARFFKGEKVFAPGKEKASTQASWFSLQLRKVFLLIDVLRFKKLLKRLSREKYDYLLSDRYFYDSVVNILYLKQAHCHSGLPARTESVRSGGDPESQTKKEDSLHSDGISGRARDDSARQPRDVANNSTLLSLIEKYIPKPNKAFYFQISAEEIMKRDRIPEQGVEYLRDKIALFEQKKEAFNLISLNASLEKEEILLSVASML